MASKLTRKACRNREMIGGIDAQLLEHALTQVEQEVATLSARLAAVEESLEFARNYNGIEGRPCPLCTYEDGVFIKSCQMHTDLAAVEKERDEWKRSSELVARVLIDTKADQGKESGE